MGSTTGQCADGGWAFMNRSYTSQTAESDLNTGQKYLNECSLLELYVLVLHLCFLFFNGVAWAGLNISMETRLTSA